ncbi:MAG: M3 family oligoendopeptidase [Acholeplasmatales bacterium]|nr:M3 family oligoendopeptidase [Acholeplasmatales bacterium]
MEKKWDLNSLYTGFQGKYLEDIELLKKLIKERIKEINDNKRDSIIYIESVIKNDEKITILIGKLFSFAELTLSTDIINEEADKYISIITLIINDSVKAEVDFQKYIKNVDLEELKKSSDIINNYSFILSKLGKTASHLLSKKEEVLYSKLRKVCGSSWGKIQEITTSNLLCDVNGESKTLTETRNLAYSADSKVRKDAYYAEQKAYKSIEDVVAISLTNIKYESNVLLKLRKYKDPITYNLEENCNMKRESLDALMSAILEFRPVFIKYLKAKAKYLGHKKSLPFYDLFAPLGKSNSTIDFDTACSLVLDSFYSFSPKLGDFAKKAIKNNWIDVYPKKGKVGGAFCANLPYIRESRVLLNFTGSLDNCLTLAHELGHAYHGEIISDELPLNTNYPMQLAETASIFCETIMGKNLISKVTDKEEKIAILEQSVSDSTQVIIDILSRYLFEEDLYKKANNSLSASKLKSMMINAQKKAYLDGLDHDILHPYMWICKGHYYSVDGNFYNFPYAFGLLYGRGLYASYLKDPEEFLKNYDKMLFLTTHATAEDVTLSMGIDITKKDFWIDSLKVIEEEINELVVLLEK